MISLTRSHTGPYGGISWRLTTDGITLRTQRETRPRTPGEPVTALKILNEYGSIIGEIAERHRVPDILILATIATETKGNSDAVRHEPGYIASENDTATPHKISVGLMQTLISTAREAVGKLDINMSWLKNPANSIIAGTAYIAGQEKNTNFDPPLVAAAYNAGGLYPQSGENNPWKLRQYPIGTGKHVDRFIAWFNDFVFVLQKQEYCVKVNLVNWCF